MKFDFTASFFIFSLLIYLNLNSHQLRYSGSLKIKMVFSPQYNLCEIFLMKFVRFNVAWVYTLAV